MEKIIKENFALFSGAIFIYSCLYVFCMYRNNSGISYGIFMAATIALICLCMKKLNIKLKKMGVFYISAIMILAISTFFTDDGRLIFFNKTGIFLLVISFLLEMLYDTKKWNLMKYLKSIGEVLIMAVGEIYRPFADTTNFFSKKENKTGRIFIYALISTIVSLPLFLAVWSLLASADIVFKSVTDKIFQLMDLFGVFQIIFMFVFMFCLSYCIMTYMAKGKLDASVTDRRILEPVIAIPVVFIMTLLYIVFSVIQVIYLFMGNLELPNGYTYAKYAREGFFQLLVVGIINLIIVMICLNYFKKNIFLKIILGVMSVCTFIMIASSAMRMIIYIQYYYLTFLRVLVLWCLAVLFMLFVGIFVYIITDRFPLFKYSLIVVTCLYIGLSFAHPDYLIAKVNIAGSLENDNNKFFKGEKYDDFNYLSRLNADAAPAILSFIEENNYKKDYYDLSWDEYLNEYSKLSGAEQAACKYVYRLNERVDDVGIRSFNVSRYYAKIRVKNR